MADYLDVLEEKLRPFGNTFSDDLRRAIRDARRTQKLESALQGIYRLTSEPAVFDIAKHALYPKEVQHVLDADGQAGPKEPAVCCCGLEGAFFCTVCHGHFCRQNGCAVVGAHHPCVPVHVVEEGRRKL